MCVLTSCQRRFIITASLNYRLIHTLRSTRCTMTYRSFTPCSLYKLGLKIGFGGVYAILGSFSSFLAVSFILDVSFRAVLFSCLWCTVSFLQYSPWQPSQVTLSSASDSLFCVHVPDWCQSVLDGISCVLFVSVEPLPLRCTKWNSLDPLIIKANKMHCFSDLFGEEPYIFRTDLLSIIRSLNTVFTGGKWYLPY
jgi:hypothetical protein